MFDCENGELGHYWRPDQSASVRNELGKKCLSSSPRAISWVSLISSTKSVFQKSLFQETCCFEHSEKKGAFRIDGKWPEWRNTSPRSAQFSHLLWADFQYSTGSSQRTPNQRNMFEKSSKYARNTPRSTFTTKILNFFNIWNNLSLTRTLSGFFYFSSLFYG